MLDEPIPSLKMLIGLEGAHAFCVSIFGGVEHLRAVPLSRLTSFGLFPVSGKPPCQSWWRFWRYRRPYVDDKTPLLVCAPSRAAINTNLYSGVVLTRTFSGFGLTPDA